MNIRVPALVFVGCVGCASKPVAPATPPPPAPQAVQAEAAADLSPVSAPPELVLVGRIARPRALVETVASWAGVPLHLTDLLPSELQSVGNVIDWDAPVELAAELDSHSTAKLAAPLFVFSIGLTSLSRALDVARQHGNAPTRVGPSVYRVRIDDDVSCVVAAAAGRAPARLVCGADDRNVDELLPYATRGLPREDLGTDDLRLEVRAAPLQRRYSQEIAAVRLLAGLLLRQGQTDSPRLDRALTDATYALADELKALAMDIDRVQVRARLDEAQNAMDVGAALAFNKDSSFSLQLLEEAGRRAAPPPDAFWALPRTAETAGFSVSLDPKRLTPLMNVGAELLDAFLEQQKVGATLRRRTRGFVEGMTAWFAPQSNASGSVPLPKQPTQIERFNHGVGWHVGVIEARADQLSKSLSDLEGALLDRELSKMLKAQFKVAPQALPKARHRAVKLQGFEAGGTAFTFELPEQLLALVSEHSAEPAPAGKGGARKAAATPALVLVADGEKTWWSIGVDEKSAITRLESARAGRDGKLSEIPELAPLRSAPVIAGGFTTLEALLNALGSVLHQRSSEIPGILSHTPRLGRTPQIARTLFSNAGGRFELSTTLRLPKPVFEDIGAMVPWLITGGSLK